MDEQLLEIVEKARQESGVPSIAGIVVSHNAIVAQAAVGVRRLGDETPVTVHDRFHTGSNAKAITATICAVLVSKGLLRWDTTPLDVFHDLTGKIMPEYETITLEMLLRHIAGIPPYTDDEDEDYVLPNWNGISVEQHITYFAKWLLQEREPVSEPGKQFSYSNAGYSIAAAMAEAVSGQSWKAMLHDYIFEPLGMDAKAGSGWPALNDPEQPWGHWVKNGVLVPHPPDDDYQPESFLAPAGDVCVSLPQYGSFLRMNLKGLQGKETILPCQLIRYLHNNGRPGTGMGWGVKTLRTLENAGLFSTHAGSGGTFVLIAGISHSSDCAVAFAANSAPSDLETLSFWFKSAIAQYMMSV